MSLKYVIYATPWSEGSGGAIVLHELCHLLNQLGREAYVWPYDDDLEKFARYEHHLTPLADREILENAVAVYPEIVDGNPLGARRVVRWFLNRPGRMTGRIDYGENELYYFYAPAFNDPEINRDLDNELRVQKTFTDIFRDERSSERSGSCFIVRKGKGRKRVHDLSGSIEIRWNMPMREIATIFNATRYCISYDLYTMLSMYAAMCGCIPIVVPEPGLSRQDWILGHSGGAVGVAYGFRDVNHAAETAPQTKDALMAVDAASRESVERFALKTEKFFEREAGT